MTKLLVFPAGSTPALRFAAAVLVRSGVPMVDHPTPEVTHLLLDVPSFGPGRVLRSGAEFEPLLRMLPPDITIVGGNLSHPALEGYRTQDLLLDPEYLARNAAITADCALQVAAPLLTTTVSDTPTLIIGWGRIGKCLAQMLKAVGCNVTVAARKEADRATLLSLGYQTADPSRLTGVLPKFRLLFNTAPEMVLGPAQLSLCRNCVKIDLASKPGLEGNDVVWARGLPGIHAPETSGQLIADTFIRLVKEDS